MDSVQRLQSWYRAQCNGEWEHTYGVLIETLDNPGWMVRIELTGTALEGLPMQTVNAGQPNHLGLEGEQEWLYCRVESNCFEGAGGPSSLSQICEVFMDWVDTRKS